MTTHVRADIRLYPLDTQRSILVKMATGERLVVPSMVGEAAMAAQRFCALNDHAQAYARVAGAGWEAAQELGSWLGRLAERGFLWSSAQLASQVFSPPERDRMALCSIAIPSGDRAEVLGRTLRTYISNTRVFGRDIPFVVFDTSKGTSSGYQVMLDGLVASTRAEIWYAGLQQRKAFADALVARGVPPDSVAFALFDPETTGHAYGTARNAALLHHAGRAFLSIDDDVECAVAPHPRQTTGVQVFTGDGPGYVNYDPHDYWFFRTRDDVHAKVAAQDVDVLAVHERYLGRQVRDILGEAVAATAGGDGASIDLAELRSARIADLIATGRAPVMVTFFGLRGDAGMYAPTWYLLKTGSSRERLVANETFYRAVCTSRELMRCVAKPTITDGRWYQGTMMGLDNRDLLPPTAPIMRYEDGVFRIVLHRMYEGGMCATAPWTVLHNRPPGYPWDHELLWKPGEWTRTGEMMVRCVQSANLEGVSAPRARLQAMGEHLVRLGTSPPAEFWAFLTERTMHQKALYCQYLDSLLSLYGRQPAYWAADVQRHIDAIASACASPDYVIPLDLRQTGRSSRDAATLVQTLVRRFGELLIAWPQMIEASRELAARGETMAVPLGR